jgi:DNA-binding response OmpR family regulator
VKRVLIVEDEPRLASFLEKGLAANGFTTFSVNTGSEAFGVARDDDFDLMILDLGLPGMDGFEVLEAVRARGEAMPVIILTARDEIDEKVRGLDAGADDYVTKPFKFEELLARVRARLRAEHAHEAVELTAGAITLDLRSRRAIVDREQVELSTREFALLETFMRHPGQVLSREQLLSRVWGYDFDPGSNIVDVYVGYLRKKVGGGTVETVRGAGYRFEPPGA